MVHGEYLVTGLLLWLLRASCRYYETGQAWKQRAMEWSTCNQWKMCWEERHDFLMLFPNNVTKATLRFTFHWRISMRFQNKTCLMCALILHQPNKVVGCILRRFYFENNRSCLSWLLMRMFLRKSICSNLRWIRRLKLSRSSIATLRKRRFYHRSRNGLRHNQP